MNRKPIIRFFVSSTFADMGMERNILKDIFKRLRKEYQTKGWQIEHVDLRWGIRNEASINNQTMRICLKELERCQTLSPQPNFIILLGERYGWIPLPEIITHNEMVGLYKLANPEEKELLTDYYEEDCNQLPEKRYCLMPKNYCGLPPSLFEERVEKPLHRLMERYADTLSPDNPAIGKFIHSATAQEIDNGALLSDSPNTQVLAYFRSLSDIPQEKQPTFCPKDKYEQLRMNQLKKNVRIKLSPENIFEPNTIDYDHYTHPSYQKYFSDEIEKRLRQLIETEITQHQIDELIYEINEHFDIAKEIAEKSVDRKDRLEPIMDYINQDEVATPLWFIAENGMGKTTLMAQVVCQCQSIPGTVVIPRFCGHTKYSCDARFFLLYFWKELREYLDKNPFAFEPDMHRILFGKRYGLFDWDFVFEPSDYFLSTWKHLPSPTRYVIILDGLDELDTSLTPWFAQMEWLPNTPLPTNIKVILTSEPCTSFPYEPNHIDIVKDWFKPLSKEDRIDFLKKYMQANSRTLTEKQWNFLYCNADRMLEEYTNQNLDQMFGYGLASPLNLALLANEMSQLHSYDDPPFQYFLSDFHAISQLSLERLMQAQNHGKEIVELTLALIVTSQLGVTDEEMSTLPAIDNDFYRQFSQNSFHFWQEENSQEKSLPAILWSRLKTDLNFFLTMRNSAAGYYTRFKHKEFKNLVNNEALLARAKQLWITYFTAQWQHENPHALSELPRLLTERYLDTHRPEYLRSLIDLLRNYHFIMLKQKLLPGEILYDFNRIESLPDIPKKIVQKMEELENEAMSLSTCRTDEEFIYRAANFPPTSYLRQSIRNSSQVLNPPLLENILSYINLNDTIICYYDVSQIGKAPILSEDGKIIISLHQNSQISTMTYATNGISSTIANSLQPIIWHGTDSALHFYAILTASECSVIRLSDKHRIFHYNLPQNTNACLEWCSLSTNGEKLVFGGVRIPALIVNLQTGQRQQFNEPIGQSMLSADGKYLWEVTEECARRYNTSDWSSKSISFEKAFNHLGINKEAAGTARILKGCSASVACIRAACFMIIIRLNENKWWLTPMYFQELVNYTLIDPDEKHVWIFIQDGGSMRFDIENDKFRIFKTYDIEAISQNLQTALSLKYGVLFNYEKQKERMVQINTENSGVNTLASDSKGDTFIVSIGKRHTEISGNDLICYEKNEGRYIEKLIHTPLIAINDYVAGCSFAPDGSCYAYSMHGAMPVGDLIIAGWPDNEVRHKETTTSCTALQFTSDSRYLVAASGDYIADGFLNLTLFTAQGEKLTEYKEVDNYDNNTSHNILLSPCNRYVLTGDKFESQIIDLVKQESLNLEGIKTGQLKISACDIFPAWNYHPNGKWAYISSYENCYRIELATGQSYIYPENGLLQFISPCGHYLFIKDEKNNLWKTSVGQFGINAERKLIAQKVFLASPAVCGEYMYILTYKNEILFTDYLGRVLQKAYFDDCIRYKTTANGLAIAKADGRVQLFSPLPQYQSNRAYVFAIARWNLKEKRQESPSVICPICGEKHQWQNQEKEMTCKTCHSILIIRN